MHIQGGMSNQPENKSSTVNATTTALGAGATWTGTGELVTAFNNIVVACKSDVDGTLYLEQSPDGTNWDSSLTYKVTGGVNEVHRLTITRPYFRARYTNGSTEQGYFRLTTIFNSAPALSAPLNLSVQQDGDAITTRPSHFQYEAAMGRREGVTTWNKFGFNADIDTGTETIWSVGGVFTPLASASTLTVVSTDAADDSAGTGAQSIIIYGVDANREAITEVVTMDGTSSVVTTNTFFGVNRAAIYLAGTGQVNAGDINITATTGGATQTQIPAGLGTTQHGFFFVQAGHTALMDWLLININKISGGASPRVTVKAWVTSLVSGAKYEVFRHVVDTAVENTIELRPSQPFIVGEKSLISFEATTNTDNTVASVRFSLVEEKN